MLMRVYNDVIRGLTSPDWPWTCMNELLVPHRRVSVGPVGIRASQHPHRSYFIFFLEITTSNNLFSRISFNGNEERDVFNSPVCISIILCSRIVLRHSTTTPDA